jgi:O-antigen/teichoic acid export membrane protein
MDTTFKPVLLLMSGRILAFAATFFVPVVLARTFNQADFGTYKQLLLIFSTLYGVAQVGLAESLFYFVPGSPRGKGRYVLNSILALTGAGVVCVALLSMGAQEVARWLSNGALAALTGLLGVYLLFMLPSAVLEIVMIARKRYVLAAVAYALSDALRAVSLVVPVLLFGPRLEWLLAGAIAYALLRLLAALVYVGRECAGELRPEKAAFQGQLGYALPFWVATLLSTFETNLHQYVVSYYFDAATFAIYAVGCLQIPLVDMVFTPTSNVMMVRMRERIGAGWRDGLRDIWWDATRKLALVFCPLVVCLLVTARDLIVLLFTERYLASVPIFMIWCTATLYGILQTDGVLRVFAETRFLMGLYAIRLVAVAALIPWFVREFGLLGAVLAAVLAGGLGKTLALARTGRRLELRFTTLLPWRGLAGISGAAVLAGLVALAVRAEVDLSTGPRLVATGIAYGVSYVALLLGLGLVRVPEGLTLAGRSWRLITGRTGVER